MINSKYALKRKLKENKNNIKFKTIEHPTSFQLGIVRNAGEFIQTNAFTIETLKDNELKNSWVYYDEIDIKNNIISYKYHNIKIEIIEI